MYVHATYWLFLFVSAALFWAAPRSWRTGLLAVLSAAYLYRQDPVATISALVSITVVLAVFSRTRIKTRRAESVALGLAALLIAQLAFHKYVHLGPGSSPGRAAIPLGLSFLTFKLIDFSMRTLNGEIPTQSFDRTMLYFFLFPAFPAGPMARIDEFFQKRDTNFSTEAWVEGLTRMIQGLVKKFALGEALIMAFLHRNAAHATMIARMRSEPTLWAWIDVFALQIYVYFDFSAYSDLAIGGARLFGYRVPENFQYPLFAPNIGEFWKRWHITLSQLCRAYIYLPMLAQTRNVQISMIVTMLVISLWHGASLGWLLWGAYHAAGLAIYAIYRQRVGPAPENPRGIGAVASWAVTMMFVSSACTFLIAPGKDGLREGLRILGHLVGI